MKISTKNDIFTCSPIFMKKVHTKDLFDHKKQFCERIIYFWYEVWSKIEKGWTIKS